MRLSIGGRLNRKQKVMNWISVTSNVVVDESNKIVTCYGRLKYTIGQDPQKVFEVSDEFPIDAFTVLELAEWQAKFNKALTKQLYQFID